MLTMGGPLSLRTDNPQGPDEEPRWMTHRRITVRVAFITLVQLPVYWDRP